MGGVLSGGRTGDRRGRAPQNAGGKGDQHGRTQTRYLQEEPFRTVVAQFEQQRIVSKLLETQLGDKVSVADAEIDQVMKANPKATREQARARPAEQGRTPHGAVLCPVDRETQPRESGREPAEGRRDPPAASVPAAPAARSRRVLDPQQPVDHRPVRRREEHGPGHLRRRAVHPEGLVPDAVQHRSPRRPKDLDKAEGVEKLLDMALRAPVLAAEAKSLGYDQDPQHPKRRQGVRGSAAAVHDAGGQDQALKEPTAEEVKAYFEKDLERFAAIPS